MSTTTTYKAGTAESTVEFGGLENNFDRSAAFKSFIEKNKRYLLVGIGLVGLLVFALIASGSSKRDEQLLLAQKTCSLSNVRPNTTTDRSLSSSDDRKALVSFRGYLEFFHRNADKIKEREKFQSLQLQSIDWLQNYVTEETISCSQGYSSQPIYTKATVKTRRLELITDCAIIELNARESESSKKWQIESASVVYDAEIGDQTTNSGATVTGGGRLLGHCNIEPLGQLDFASHHRYQCQQNQSLDCKMASGFHKKDPIYVRLWIEELEFELNGNADIIKDGLFSKPISSCILPTATGESRR